MNQKLVSWAKAISKKNIFLRRLLRKGGNILGAVEFYRNTHGCQVKSHTVVFSAFYGQNFCCTPKAVYLYMLQQPEYEDWHFIWVMKEPGKHADLARMPRTTIVRAGSPEYERAMASSEYWVFNHRMADYIVPKKNQTYVQCWHGTPLKSLGYDITATENALNSISEIRDKYRVDARRFNYLLSPSPFATEHFKSAWNLTATGQEKKILEVGYPRNDYLFHYTKQDTERIRERLNLPAGKKVLLYAPTWRDNQHSDKLGYVYKNAADFDYLRQELGEEWVILFRAHYIVANDFDFSKYEGFVYNVSDYDDIDELYVIADALVTDYSSVFFDYANLNRPMLFFMYDLESYGEEIRGFYMDPHEVPGPVVKTEKELVEQIRTISIWFKPETAYRQFHEVYNPKDDGNAAARLVAAVFERK